jgi:hypothetical protein
VSRRTIVVVAIVLPASLHAIAAFLALTAVVFPGGGEIGGMGAGIGRSMLRDLARVCGLPFGPLYYLRFGLDFAAAVLANVFTFWGLVLFLVTRRKSRDPTVAGAVHTGS